MYVFFKKILIIAAVLVFPSIESVMASDKVIKIAGWDVYSDPVYPNKTIGFRDYEKKTGVKIEFTPFSNMDDIISAAESEQDYDVFIISNEGISLLHDMGLVNSIDLGAISNYQNLHHNLKHTNWSQFESKTYAVPWAWGPTGLMYNKDVIKNPNSWNVLWDDAYKGKVAMWDDVSMIWTTALALGYKNVYSLTKNQLKEVQAKLIAFNRQEAFYYAGGGDELELAKQGKLVAFNAWYDPSSRLKAAGKNFSMFIPKEGAVGMFDSYLISKRSNNKDLALEYINFQISPEIQQQMVRITGLAPANIETLAILEENEIRALHLDDPDYFNRMLLWDHMPRKNLYDDVLKAVKADRNQS